MYLYINVCSASALVVRPLVCDTFLRVCGDLLSRGRTMNNSLDSFLIQQHTIIQGGKKRREENPSTDVKKGRVPTFAGASGDTRVTREGSRAFVGSTNLPTFNSSSGNRIAAAKMSS